jgi:putative ATP-binding cassette transporter
LAVPRVADDVADADIRYALKAVGLGHLTGQLDEEAEWSIVLSAGEQQLIGLARALILKPAVLLLDDADALTQGGRMQDLLAAVLARLPDTIVISATRFDTLAGLHRRTVRLGATGLGEARLGEAKPGGARSSGARPGEAPVTA